jgi:hypothetical protein
MYLGLLLLGVAPGILMFAPLIKALFVGLTPQLVGVVMIFPVMLLGLLAPLIDVLTQRLALPRLALAAGIVFLVTGSFTSGFDMESIRAPIICFTQWMDRLAMRFGFRRISLSTNGHELFSEAILKDARLLKYL